MAYAATGTAPAADRHARGGHGHRAEGDREPAERADQHRDARDAKARAAQHHESRRLRRSICRASRPSRASGRAATASARRTCTCAAWSAARTAITPPRSRASAPISTSSRSPRSTARSTSMSTTSRASRCSRVRREPSTARARRPARSASSPTSPIRRSSRRATTSSGDAVNNGGGTGWKAEAFVNIPLTPWAAVRLVGWDEHDPGYISNVAGTDANAGIIDGVRTFPTSGPSPVDNASSVLEQLQHRRVRGRPSRAEAGHQRQLDGDADVHGPADSGERLLRI